jgi:NAD(P)-dependent dehydrogenase (short-subunit alcohol dehydrogenase family)
VTWLFPERSKDCGGSFPLRVLHLPGRTSGSRAVKTFPSSRGGLNRLRAERAAQRAGRAAPDLRRAARETKDVAAVAAFLASDEAEYITGQAINVSGGSIMH